MSCGKLFKIVHVYLGTSGGSILNVQCNRTPAFLVNYPNFFESVFADVGRSK